MPRLTWSARLAFAVYLAALTVLLLVPDPLALLGMTRLPGPDDGRGVHFLAFTILGFLAMGSGFRTGTGRLALALVLYALATESLQGLVSARKVELLDYIENLLGVAAGATAWTLLEWFARRQPAAAEEPAE